jgi:hypothetical protein
VEVERLSLRLAKFQENRDPQTPQYDQSEYYGRAGLDFDLRVLRYGFVENYVHTESKRDGTVATVGWHWMAGLRLYPGIDVFQEHHSQHILDTPSQVNRVSTNKFPVEDSFGVRFNIVLDNRRKYYIVGEE